MAKEDFGTFTKVDPNSRITKGTRRVTWTALQRNEDAYVYDDKGAANFNGDFTHYLTVSFTATETSAEGGIWALTNDLDDLRGIDTANGDALFFAFLHSSTPNLLRFSMIEVDGGTQYQSTLVTVVLSTVYYLKIVRNESVGTYGTLYCYVYSDAARTALTNTLSVTLHTSKKDFRYVHVIQTWNAGTAHKSSGYSEDLELLASLETPSVATLSMTDYAATTITGNGVINSLGLSAVTAHGHAWNTAVDPVTGDNNVDNGAGSLGVFTSSITGLIDGQTYWARAYVTNSAGTTYGANVKFTTNRSNLELIPGEYSIKGEKFHYVSTTGIEYEVLGIPV